MCGACDLQGPDGKRAVNACMELDDGELEGARAAWRFIWKCSFEVRTGREWNAIQETYRRELEAMR